MKLEFESILEPDGRKVEALARIGDRGNIQGQPVGQGPPACDASQVIGVTEMRPAEEILLPLQRVQRSHDELVHRDILGFDVHTRLKHMVLHFYKYAGRIEGVRASQDLGELRRTLIDAFIVCMASANAVNLSLGDAISINTRAVSLDDLALALYDRRVRRSPDLFATAVSEMVLIGGKMAKAIESADHMEDGNPMAAMRDLIPELTESVLALLCQLSSEIECEVRSRLASVERKSIFASATNVSEF